MRTGPDLSDAHRLPERVDRQTWAGIARDLAAASERRDMELLLSCLRRLSLAYGMSEVARQTGIDRVSLYRMLNRPSNPKIGNLLLLLDLFGIRLQFSVPGKPRLHSDVAPLAPKPRRVGAPI